MVVWITGLAGVGKSTIAAHLADRLRSLDTSVVVFDGDDLRQVWGDVHGYSAEDREWLARSYGRLCRLVSSQGHVVICATISLIHSIQDWNREHIQDYVEVYVRAPLSVCQARGRESLYSNQTAGPVVGREIKEEEPKQPDVTLNNGSNTNVDELVDQLLQFLQARESR
jgi:adenylylsulfate kinase-like enzyme